MLIMCHTKESGLFPDEIMTSESQERMLIITDKKKLQKLRKICDKFRVMCSTIGHVKSDKMLHVKKGHKNIGIAASRIYCTCTIT